MTPLDVRESFGHARCVRDIENDRRNSYTRFAEFSFSLSHLLRRPYTGKHADAARRKLTRDLKANTAIGTSNERSLCGLSVGHYVSPATKITRASGHQKKNPAGNDGVSHLDVNCDE